MAAQIIVPSPYASTGHEVVQQRLLALTSEGIAEALQILRPLMALDDLSEMPLLVLGRVRCKLVNHDSNPLPFRRGVEVDEQLVQRPSAQWAPSRSSEC